MDYYKLFQHINIKDNNQFSLMDQETLEKLLLYLCEYYLEYRSPVNINCLTFGFEIEIDDTYSIKLRQELKNLLNDRLYEEVIPFLKKGDEWVIKKDSTVYNGDEVTTPIFTNSIYNWNTIYKVLEIMNRNGCIHENCGGHIHIGAQFLGNNPNSWLNFMKLWTAYENIIFRFSYGEYLNARSRIINEAFPISNMFFSEYEVLSSYHNASAKYILNAISKDRKQAVNFNNVYDFERERKNNTIEFRCPNGTLNPIIWQNNLNFFVHLLKYSKSVSFNHKIVENRINKNREKFCNLDFYGKIDYESSIELADLIFDNNLDKLYFLRQYFKDFEESNYYIESKSFTRKS